jgi:hypothetical protein
MGIFSRLWRRPSEPPVERVSDARLGELAWSPAEDGWVGVHSGVAIVLSRSAGSSPTESLRDYAASFLDDQESLQGAFDEARRGAIAEYGPGLAAEIEGLSISLLNFFERKGRHRMIADLAGGHHDRSWRMEFTGRSCDGIGFDT